ncbi:MAG: hypothetical protein PHQ23_17245, partial [Candidatus Wallbacteria bacterium]|nr:hypothetical protein [Candidatus Wallbacteria bacterium]
MSKSMMFFLIFSIVCLFISGCLGGSGGDSQSASSSSVPQYTLGSLKLNAVYKGAAMSPARAAEGASFTVATILKCQTSSTPVCPYSAPQFSSYINESTLPYNQTVTIGSQVFTFAGFGVFDFADRQGLVQCVAGEDLMLMMAIKDTEGNTLQCGLTAGIKVAAGVTNSSATVEIYDGATPPAGVLSAVGLSQQDFAQAVVPSVVTLPSTIKTISRSYTTYSTTTASVRTLLDQAKTHLDSNQFNEALLAYSNAVSADSVNIEANIGMAMLKLANLVTDPDVQNIAFTILDADDWADFPQTMSDLLLPDEPEAAPSLTALSAVSDYINVIRRSPQDLISVPNIQSAISSIISQLDVIESALRVALLNPDFSYTVDTRLTGAQQATTFGLEVPYVALFAANMLEAQLHFLTAYNLDCNLDRALDEDGYDPFEDTAYPNFGTLKTSGLSAMQSARECLYQAFDNLENLIAYMFDNQQKFVASGIDASYFTEMSEHDILTMLSFFSQSLYSPNYPLTVTLNPNTAQQEDLSFNLYNFFEYPINYRTYYFEFDGFDPDVNTLNESLDYSFNGLFKIGQMTPTTAMILKYARTATGAYYEQVQFANTGNATITMDGSKADWSGINPVVEDAEDQDSASYHYSDIKAIYQSEDANYYYALVEYYGSSLTPAPMLTVYFKTAEVQSVKLGALSAAYGFRCAEGSWPREGAVVLYYPTLLTSLAANLQYATGTSNTVFEIRVPKTLDNGQTLSMFNVVSATSGFGDYARIGAIPLVNGYSSLIFAGPGISEHYYGTWIVQNITGVAFHYDFNVEGFVAANVDVLIEAQYYDHTTETWLACTEMAGDSGTTVSFDPVEYSAQYFFAWDYLADGIPGNTSEYYDPETDSIFRMRASMLDGGGTRIYGKWSYSEDWGL